MRMKSKFFRLSLAAAVALAAPLVAGSAMAQGYGSGGWTIEGPAGVTTIDRWADGPIGDRRGRAEITGPNGGEWTREWSRRYDPYTDTYTRRSRTTGPYGGSRTVEGVTRRTGPGEFYNSRRITGPYGNSRRVDRRIRRRW